MIVFSVGALTDLERIYDFNTARDPDTAHEHLEHIRSAVMMLEEHPEIGRPVRGSTLRELVISRGKSGYVALYEFSRSDGHVRVVGIRHQREAGYGAR